VDDSINGKLANTREADSRFRDLGSLDTF